MRKPTSAAVRAMVTSVTILAGCGGGGTDVSPPPPPPPGVVVATVEVSAPAVTLPVGQTVQLTAIPRTTAGVAIGGRTVTWTSSSGAVATVSAAGLVTGVSPGSVTMTASVEGVNGSIQLAVQSTAVLEAGRLVTRQVGPQGDSLSTTGSNGVTYTLVIPEGAVRSGVTITVTPVISLPGLPFSAGLLAGVELKPSGTTFDRPLTLRIAGAPATSAGMPLVGFTLETAGQAPDVLPASVKNGVISVVVPHFSLVGTAPALPSELAALAPLPNVQNRVTDFANVALALAQGTDLTSTLGLLEVAFTRWYARILPMLNAGRFGDTELLGALEEYRYWVDIMEWAGGQLGTSGSLVLLPALTALNGQALGILRTDLGAAITRANQACVSGRDLPKAENVLFWQEAADQLGLGSAELSRASVMTGLCVRVFVSDSTFPGAPPVNQSSDLHLRFGIQFGSDPLLRSTPMAVQLVITGTTADGTVDAQTDPTGKFDFTVVPSGQVLLRIAVKACLLPADVGADDVCVNFVIERPFGITLTGSITVSTPQGLASLSNVARIVGSLTVTGPMPDLEALASLQEVSGSVTLTAMPELTSLAGLRNLRTVNSLCLCDLAKVPSVDGLDQLRAVPGVLNVFKLPLVRNLQGLAQLLRIGTLALGQMSQVTTLAGLGQATIEQGLVISSMPLLTTLAGLGPVEPVLEGTVAFGGNPLLTSAAALASVTTIDGDLTFVGVSPFTGPVLGALTSVGGNVTFTGATGDPVAALPPIGGGIDVGRDLVISGTMSSVAGLNVRRVGRSILIQPDLLPNLNTFSLPALIDGSILVLFQSACAARPPMVIDLPALTFGIWQWGGSSPRPACLVDLLLPAYRGLPGGGQAYDMSHVRNYSFGPIQAVNDLSFAAADDAPTPITSLVLSGLTAGTLHVGRMPRLTSITLTGVSARNMNVVGSPLLSSMTAGGSVSGQIAFFGVPLLSDARMIAIGQALGVQAVFRSNGSAIPTRLFPP